MATKKKRAKKLKQLPPGCTVCSGGLWVRQTDGSFGRCPVIECQRGQYFREQDGKRGLSKSRLTMVAPGRGQASKEWD